MKNWFRELIIGIVIDNLVVGGHCGLCGEWVDKAIVPVYWRWTVCPKCAAPNNASSGLAGMRSAEIKYPKPASRSR